jgi:hypothetical protein
VIVVGIESMRWPHEAQLAYIAGLIDGEGYVGVKRRMPTAANKMTSPRYAPTVSIDMTDAEPIEFVARFVGAPELPRWRHRGTNKPILSLQLENARAAALLRDVQPYLIAKRWRADLVLELATLRSKSRAHRTKPVGAYVFAAGRAAGHQYVTRGLSDDFVAACDSIYTRLLVGSARSGKGAYFPRAAS